MSAIRERPLATCFFGVLVPDEAEFHGPAFSRAGLMFQEGLLRGLTAASLRPDAIYSIEPVPAIPRGRRLFGKTGRYVTRAGLTVRMLPFLNVQPLKWASTGVSVLTAILRWSWRNRHARRAIQCLNLTMPPGVFVWLGARLTGSKAIVWVLDVFEPGVLVGDTWFRRLDFALQRWLLPRFDGVMVVSQAIADDFVPGKRVCRIEGGVSPELFGDRRDRRPPEPHRPFRIVLSGSLETYNGVSLALEAVAKLPSGFELVVAGTGSFASRLHEAAAADRRVIFEGFLGFHELLELYRSADLLLNLRITRTLDTKYFFPSKLMELLASGTPVLSTCTGHVREEYGGVLYLLEEESADALAAKILEIAATPAGERATLAARARAFVLSEKSWERQGERLAGYIRTEVFREAPTARASWSG